MMVAAQMDLSTIGGSLPYDKVQVPNEEASRLYGILDGRYLSEVTNGQGAR